MNGKHFVVLKFWVVVFRSQENLIQNRQPLDFQEVGGVTQHVMFYPRQEIF